MISGEEYKKVPIGSDVLSLIRIEQLKSPNFIIFSPFSVLKNIFCGLISLCIIPF